MRLVGALRRYRFWWRAQPPTAAEIASSARPPGLRTAEQAASIGPRPALAKYLGGDEQVVLETRQHPFAVVGSFVEALRLLIPMLLCAWGISGIVPLRNPVGDVLVQLLLLCALAVLARLFWHILGWEHSRVVVSTEKLVHVHGIITRRIASTPLVKVSELTVSQPFFGRLFGYGSLVVESPGGGERALHGLTYIPDPATVYRIITDTARRERAFEGGARTDPIDGTPFEGGPEHSAPRPPLVTAAADDAEEATAQLRRPGSAPPPLWRP